MSGSPADPDPLADTISHSLAHAFADCYGLPEPVPDTYAIADTASDSGAERY